MAELNRIYARTEAGLRALDSPGSGLRAETRWLLGLIKSETHGQAVRGGMRRYSDERILELLAELENLCFVESVAATSEHDLDFTDSLSLAALSAAHNAAAR
jgi:hypothetical protein